MKKLILILTVFALVTVTAFAQDKQNSSASAQTTNVQSSPSDVHYVCSTDGKTMKCCMGNCWKDQNENVKLANGTIVTNKGEVATHHWTKVTKLKPGQCVDANGNIIDHKQLHSEAEAKK